MYDDFARLIHAHQHIGLIAHFRPDGDAIGSTLALGLALKSMGKTVRLFNEDAVPSGLLFLEGTHLFERVPCTPPAELSLLICLDNGAWKRLGDHAIEVFAPQNHSMTIANFDHHASNEKYGDVNLVEAHEAATACMVYKLLKVLEAPLTPAIAAALYVGINTDTGSFQYGSTTPQDMRIAAELMEQGLDVADINTRLYQESPLSELRLKAQVLQDMVLEEGGQLIHYSLDAATIDAMGLSQEDSKDLVDVIRVVEGVKAAIIFEDLRDGRIRMSLRSKDPRVNVARVAERFGGGGHHMAAGIRMKGSIEECRERVLVGLREEIQHALSL